MIVVSNASHDILGNRTFFDSPIFLHKLRTLSKEIMLLFLVFLFKILIGIFPIYFLSYIHQL